MWGVFKYHKMIAYASQRSKVGGAKFVHASRPIPLIKQWSITIGMKKYLAMNWCQFGITIVQFYEWLGSEFDLEVDKILVQIM